MCSGWLLVVLGVGRLGVPQILFEGHVIETEGVLG